MLDVNQLNINPELEFREIESLFRRASDEYHLNKGICAISFGLDSTVVLYLMSRIFGAGNVFAIYMPTSLTSSETQELSESLTMPKIDFIKIGLERTLSEIPGYHQSLEMSQLDLERELSPQDYLKPIVLPHLPQEKEGRGKKAWGLYLKGYLRAAIAWSVARREGAIFATSANKTEYYTGLFGLGASIDSTGHVQPIKHLYKTQVYQLAKWLGVPDRIVNRYPTADTGAPPDELLLSAPYEVVDIILYGYIDKKLTRDQIIAGFTGFEVYKKRFNELGLPNLSLSDVVDNTIELVRVSEPMRNIPQHLL